MALNLSNPKEMTRGDFEKMIKIHDIDVFESKKVEFLQKALNDTLEKSEKGELSEENKLSDEEKNNSEIVKAELDSLEKITVLNDDFSKSIFFVREKQVDFDKDGLEKGELGEIITAKSGTFLDTELNRKLERVGKKYGEVKNEE